MLQRILIIVLALYAVWRLLAAAGRRVAKSSPGADSYSRFSPHQRRQRRQWAADPEVGVEKLVACSVCGTLVPSRRLLSAASGRVVCSEACRERLEQEG